MATTAEIESGCWVVVATASQKYPAKEDEKEENWLGIRHLFECMVIWLFLAHLQWTCKSMTKAAILIIHTSIVHD